MQLGMTIHDSKITPLHNIIKDIIISSLNKSIIPTFRLNETYDFKSEDAQCIEKYMSTAEPCKNRLDHLKMKFSITMHEYIKLCLYHPEHGYYKSRDVVGKDADFITSPEISQMFGECIAAYIIDYLYSNNIKEYILVELGPGNGTLMSDMLRVFGQYKYMPQDIYMVEVSDYLREAQKNKLSNYNINWVEDISQISTNLPIICISNEFFDAFPPKIFVSNEEECMVTIDENNNFCYIDDHAGKPKFEINELGQGYATRLDAMLPKNSLLIAIDYGYTENIKGFSLQSISKHQKVNFFLNPGQNDITFLVDFTSLSNCFARAVEKNIITQREFLVNCGILQRADFLITKSPDKKDYIKNCLNRLINEDEMGNNFKVLIGKY